METLSITSTGLRSTLNLHSDFLLSQACISAYKLPTQHLHLYIPQHPKLSVPNRIPDLPSPQTTLAHSFHLSHIPTFYPHVLFFRPQNVLFISHLTSIHQKILSVLLKYPDPEHFSSSSFHHFRDSYNGHPPGHPAVTFACLVVWFPPPPSIPPIPVQPKCYQGAPQIHTLQWSQASMQSLQGPTSVLSCSLCSSTLISLLFPTLGL